MSDKFFKDLKNTVKEFVHTHTKESIAIGIAAVAIVGYLTYRWIYKSDGDSDDKNNGNAEDGIKEIETTPGSYEQIQEEEKGRNVKFIQQTDSEDEPILLKQAIKPKRDTAGVLDRDTLVRIFDKRSTIRGIRKLERTFKEKRRAAFNDQPEYK